MATFFFFLAVKTVQLALSLLCPLLPTLLLFCAFLNLTRLTILPFLSSVFSPEIQSKPPPLTTSPDPVSYSRPDGFEELPIASAPQAFSLCHFVPFVHVANRHPRPSLLRCFLGQRPSPSRTKFFSRPSTLPTFCSCFLNVVLVSATALPPTGWFDSVFGIRTCRRLFSSAKKDDPRSCCPWWTSPSLPGNGLPGR